MEMFSFGLLHAGLMRARRQRKTKRKQEGNGPISFRACIGGYLIIYQIFQGLYLAYLKRYGPET